MVWNLYNLCWIERCVCFSGVTYSIIDDLAEHIDWLWHVQGLLKGFSFILMSAAVIIPYQVIIWLIMYFSMNPCIPWIRYVVRKRKCYLPLWEKIVLRAAFILWWLSCMCWDSACLSCSFERCAVVACRETVAVTNKYMGAL